MLSSFVFSVNYYNVCGNFWIYSYCNKQLNCTFFFTVKDTEMKRSKDAFKRVATLGGQMSDIVFCREVLGDGVPAGIANVSP